MTINSFQIYQYQLPLTEQLTFHDQTLTTRSGLLIKLTNEKDHTGWGEIAPLPGFSRESLEEVVSQVKGLNTSLLDSDLPDGVEALSGAFGNWLKPFKLHPSVQCGLEMAVLNLLASSRNIPLVNLLSDKHVTDFRVNCLVIGSGETAITHIRNLAADGYQSVKLKVGREPVKEDINLVRTLSAVIPMGVAVRLDANRAWDLDQAVAFAEGIKGARIEYVEEPLADISQLLELIARTSLPVALDESLLEQSHEGYSPPEGVKALVLKPTLLGGLEKVMMLARQAKASGIKAVISSSFESSFGLACLAQLAASLGDRQTAHGLDTASWFKTDLVDNPIQVSAGRIDVSTLPTAENVKPGFLTEVSGG